jgi:uncharacterized protein YoxC
MSNDTANTIVVAAAIAALVAVAIAALIAAVALWRVARDVRNVSGSLNEVTAALRDELPPTLKELRQTAANLNRVSDELGPRLIRVDLLLDEAEATIQSVRATAETAEDIVRGPVAAMDRAKRAAGAAGRALASSADRIRRGVEGRMSRSDDDDGGDRTGGDRNSDAETNAPVVAGGAKDADEP